MDGRREGFGVYRYKDGSVYTGQWARNVRHGIGRHVSLNGDLYVGDYVDDKRHGLGATVSDEVSGGGG